jgi:hypothetical protein
MKLFRGLFDLLEQYRPLFLARNRREKVLVAAFIVVIVAIWAGTLPGRVGDRFREVRLAREAIERQDGPLSQRERIEAEYQRGLESLDPQTMPPRPEVVARLEGMARQSGLSPRIEPSTSTRSDRLVFHLINVSFDRVPFLKVAEFQRAVSTTLPSVNLKTLVLNSRSAQQGSAEMSARLTFEAIEHVQ